MSILTPELTPNDIISHLKSRLEKTNLLFGKIDADSIDETKTVFFRYYFDFSTAIEATIKNIVILKYGNDNFLAKKIDITNNGKSKYYDADDIVPLLSEFDEIDQCEINSDMFSGLCSALAEMDISNKLNDFVKNLETFKTSYKNSRRIRNQIAHGLTEQNVKYDKSTLLQFASSYFVLHCYYELLYARNANDSETIDKNAIAYD